MSSLLSLSSENLTRKKESKGQTPLNKALYPTIGRWLAIIKRLEKERTTKTCRCSFSVSKTNWFLNIGDDSTVQFGKGNMINQKERKRRKRNGVPAESYKVITATNKQPINLVYIQNNKEYKCHTTICPNKEPSNY